MGAPNRPRSNIFTLIFAFSTLQLRLDVLSLKLSVLNSIIIMDRPLKS